MRVGFDGQPLLGSLTGVGHYTRELIRALARADEASRFTVLTYRSLRSRRRAVPAPFDAPNVDLAVAGLGETLVARLVRRLGREAVVGASIQPPCDVYHATNNTFPYRPPARRTVLTIHDLTTLLFPEWHPRERLDEIVPRLAPSAVRADQIITPSASAKSDVVSRLGVEPDRVTVVPEGVDAAFTPLGAAELSARLSPLGLHAGTYLLFLGTIEPRKNLLRLLEARERAGPDVGQLVLAGGHGWGDEGIRDAIRRLEATGRVRALGYVADSLRPALLGGARAFVYPSLYEGFGLPPLEAMACGTPVVTSNVSSLPDVVGDAAILVPPEDVTALTSAMVRVWSDDTLRAELRGRGLARARTFTWERTARLTLDVYRDVLSRGPSSTLPPERT